VVCLRSEKEITDILDIYKQQLALAIEEKSEPLAIKQPNIDLIIFSLIDKLEILFWVLGMPLPENDLLDNLYQTIH